MKILVQSLFERSISYIITKEDKSDYCSIQGDIIPTMYDDDENPLTEEVKEMDECIKNWKPERFVEIFNNLMRTKNKNFYSEVVW